MRIESVEWSLERSPEVVIEAWAVAATIETVLRVRIGETLGTEAPRE